MLERMFETVIHDDKFSDLVCLSKNLFIAYLEVMFIGKWSASLWDVIVLHR